MRSTLLFIAVLWYTSLMLHAQNKDKSEFVDINPGFYQKSILRNVSEVDDSLKPKEKKQRFQMVQDISVIPHKLTDYTRYWAFPPVSQGSTGTCWSFSTTSFLESEVKRLYNKEVRLSEMFTVYCEYIEKARRFVRERGDSEFGEGSESNAVTRIFRTYGAMPLSVYPGILNNRKFYTHEVMFNEMDTFLKSVKAASAWNEEWVIGTVKNIMNHHMGIPPERFTYEGKEYTPLTFVRDYLKINPGDYVEILSYMQEPYWQKVEYKVPDNWWHSKDYYNVPLDVFTDIVKKSIRNGYTICIGGDVSEPGFSRSTQAAMVPDFDIPSSYINENARQFRFTNKTTTDDHGMHLVGYCERDGKDWYLIKDSSSGSRNNDPAAPEFGYYFFHEDYVKLKIMDFTIHKDAVKEILQKF